MHRSLPLLTAAALFGLTGQAAMAQREGYTIPHTALADLRARVEHGWAHGFLLAVVDAQGARYLTIGAADTADVYEIGSVTKVVTGLLLADMALRGEIDLTDSLAAFVPEWRGTAVAGVSLEHLASHRAGIPRDPPDLSEEERTGDPFGRYDAARLRALLSSLPTVAPGEHPVSYSNLGAGLLGEALARRAGTSWIELARDRVLAPLGMTSTGVGAHPRLMQGYRDGQPTDHWTFATLQGAGSLHSSVTDLVRLLQAALGYLPSRLDSALQLADARRLGWQVIQANGRRIVWHDGGTGGFRSLVGYDRERGYGLVLLTNSAENLDLISAHLFDSTFALPPVLPRRALPPHRGEEYAGRYPLTPGFELSVEDAGDCLSVRATGQDAHAVWWVEGDRFAYRVVDAELLFERDGQGQVQAVVLRQNGVDQRAPKATTGR